MDDSLTHLHADMRACRRCLLAGHAITPGAIFSSGRERQVLLIGQAPGVTEVTAQRPFNATSGTRLFKWLGAAGWDEDDFRARHTMTAVTKCYPGKDKSGKGDRVPGKAEQALCRPFLQREIALTNPRLIILVGGLAIKLLYPAGAKLKDVIGTAVYFPPQALANPANFNFDDGHLLRADALSSLLSSPPQGRLVVPLPHPSGASLWPNKAANKALLDQAVTMLQVVRTVWGL